MLTRLTEVLVSEELVIPLKSRLKMLERYAVRLRPVAAISPAPSHFSPAGIPVGAGPVSVFVVPVPPAFTGNGAAPAAPVLVEEAQNADLNMEAAATVLKNP